MLVFMNGAFIAKEEANISSEDRGFLFADGVYEVIRCYNGSFFQMDAHLRRMERSLHEVRIPYRDVEGLKGVAERLITKNSLLSGQATVYMQITRGAAPRLHRFPPEDVPPTVYASAFSFQPHQEELKEGIQVILVPDIRWSRCDIKSIALLPNVLANQQAAEHGASEALFVRDGAVTEGTRSNFFAVYGGQLVTTPRSNYILSGITRQIVLGLSKKLEIPLKEFPIFENQLKDAEEMFITSTIAEITPIVGVNGWQVGEGKPGSVTKRLQKSFYELLGRDNGALSR